MNTVPCYDCGGEGVQFGFRHSVKVGEPGGTTCETSWTCDTCGGTCLCPERDPSWAIAGEDARMFRVHTLRMTMGAAARRVGWSVVQVSEAETGRVDPAALGQLYKALSRVIG